MGLKQITIFNNRKEKFRYPAKSGKLLPNLTEQT